MVLARGSERGGLRRLLWGSLYALNARIGDRLWSYATGGYVESSPAVVNGVVYVGSWDGNVYAFSLKHGRG